MPIATINPATGETLKTFEPLSDAQIDRKLQIAAETFLKYRKTSFAERAQLVQRAGKILEEKKEKFTRMMKTEMGKTFRSAVEEAAKCAWACSFKMINGEY